MLASPLAEVLGRPAEGVVRLAVVQRRGRTFRLWGLFELVLKAFAFIILIPLWIVLLFSALSLDGDGDMGGGDSGGRKDKDKRKAYGKSSLFTYHHELLVRLIGADGQTIEERLVRAESESHAEQLMASILAYADRARLIVSESIDVNPSASGPVELAQIWYGGRALLHAPGLRSAASLEAELVKAGFEIEPADGEIIVRRAFTPMAWWGPWLLIIVVIVSIVVIGIVGTPLSLILGAPFIVFAMWMARREIGGFLFDLLCGLLRLHERFELRLTPGTISYRHRNAWRSAQGSTEGADLIGVGFSAGLGPAPTIDRTPPALRIIGKQTCLRLPAKLSVGVGPMLSEWVTSTMLSLRSGHAEHDYRSRCAYCGAPYDLDEHEGCPKCGAAHLQ